MSYATEWDKYISPYITGICSVPDTNYFSIFNLVKIYFRLLLWSVVILERERARYRGGLFNSKFFSIVSQSYWLVIEQMSTKKHRGAYPQITPWAQLQ